MKNSAKNSEEVFRIDGFKVPAAVRSEFTRRAHASHQRLRTLPGFVEDHLLESTGQDGTTNVVTIVIWTDAAAYDAAKATMQRHYGESGYDPGVVLKSLGIEADMAAYTQLQIQSI
jgi:heme-degrading monooxygenase HmoA